MSGAGHQTDQLGSKSSIRAAFGWWLLAGGWWLSVDIWAGSGVSGSKPASESYSLTKVPKEAQSRNRSFASTVLNRHHYQAQTAAVSVLIKATTGSVGPTEGKGPRR